MSATTATAATLTTLLALVDGTGAAWMAGGSHNSMSCAKALQHTQLSINANGWQWCAMQQPRLSIHPKACLHDHETCSRSTPVLVSQGSYRYSLTDFASAKATLPIKPAFVGTICRHPPVSLHASGRKSPLDVQDVDVASSKATKAAADDDVADDVQEEPTGISAQVIHAERSSLATCCMTHPTVKLGLRDRLKCPPTCQVVCMLRCIFAGSPQLHLPSLVITSSKMLLPLEYKSLLTCVRQPVRPSVHASVRASAHVRRWVAVRAGAGAC
eukprot:6214598-Pleurochrysis_carterae.AAC.1